jgi:hypothetical protein
VYFKKNFLRNIAPIAFYYLMLSIQLGSVDLNLWLFWVGTVPKLIKRAGRLCGLFKKLSLNLNVILEN